MGDYCNPPPTRKCCGEYCGTAKVVWWGNTAAQQRWCGGGILRHSKGGVVGEYCDTEKVVWWRNIVTQKR